MALIGSSIVLFSIFIHVARASDNIESNNNSKVSNMSSTTQDIDIDLEDIAPPFGAHLSGKYKKSFAYDTLKDRAPVIVTRVIDHISRNKDSIIQKYGQDSIQELKELIGNLSELKSELMTNKPLQLLNCSDCEANNDISEWNNAVEKCNVVNEKPAKWYNCVWLFSECYMYRRIAQIFSLTKTLSTFDPFEEQKQQSFKEALTPISSLAIYTLSLLKNSNNNSSSEQKINLMNLLKLNLWGNRCDLSLSAGAALLVEENTPVERVMQYEENLLIDDSPLVFDFLSKVKETNNSVIIDIVFDNAGYELFTDLCLATFLSTHGFAHKIRFYVKRFPWFVSDTTERDFHWMIDELNGSNNSDLKALGEKCSNFLRQKQWTVELGPFWTKPYDYSQMKSAAPELYNKLSEAALVIFKGDLNYRKLLGDINWEYNTDFKTALRGFHPSSIVSLRTVKADLIVGMSPEKVTELFKIQPNWMTTGDYGIIQSTLVEEHK